MASDKTVTLFPDVLGLLEEDLLHQINPPPRLSETIESSALAAWIPKNQPDKRGGALEAAQEDKMDAVPQALQSLRVSHGGDAANTDVHVRKCCERLRMPTRTCKGESIVVQVAAFDKSQAGGGIASPGPC
eukprot:749388-Hanusia_phi.AAC.1